jgi:hypothetical protein
MPTMTESKEPSHPQAILVGNRTVTPDTSPLPVREKGKEQVSIGQWGFLTIVQTGGHSLVLRRSARGYGCLLLTVPLGAAGTVFFATAAAFPSLRPQLIPLAGDQWPTWVLVVLTVFFLFWLLLWNIRANLRQLLGGGRVRFDTSTGLWTFGPIWSRQSRPLSQIVAVQLLSDVVSLFPAGKGVSPTQSIKYYQMNLVLDDMNTPRINVAVSQDHAWTQPAGKQLADFLGVPLVNVEQ